MLQAGIQQPCVRASKRACRPDSSRPNTSARRAAGSAPPPVPPAPALSAPASPGLCAALSPAGRPATAPFAGSGSAACTRPGPAAELLAAGAAAAPTPQSRSRARGSRYAGCASAKRRRLPARRVKPTLPAQAASASCSVATSVARSSALAPRAICATDPSASRCLSRVRLTWTRHQYTSVGLLEERAQYSPS
jgi:hypothetical protein